MVEKCLSSLRFVRGVTVGGGVKIEIDINVDIKSSLRAFALLFWMKMV